MFALRIDLISSSLDATMIPLPLFVFSPGLMIHIFNIYPLCFDRFLTFGFYFSGEIVFIYSLVTLIDGSFVGEKS